MSLAIKNSFSSGSKSGPSSPSQHRTHRGSLDSTAPVLPPLQLSLTPSGPSPISSRLNLSNPNSNPTAPSSSLAHRPSHDSARDPRQLHAALQRASSHQSATSPAQRSTRSQSHDAGLPAHAHVPVHVARKSSLSTHHRDESQASLSWSLRTSDTKVPRRGHTAYAQAGASPPLPPLPPKQEDESAPVLVRAATAPAPAPAPAPPPAFEPARPNRPPQHPNRRASLSASAGPRPKVESPKPFQLGDLAGLGLGLSHPALALDVRGLTPPPSPPPVAVASAGVSLPSPVPGPARTARPVKVGGRYGGSPRQSVASAGSYGSRRSSNSSQRKSSLQWEAGTKGGESEGIPSLVIGGRDTPPASPINRGGQVRSASEGSLALSQTLSRSRSRSSLSSGGGSLPPGAGAGAPPPSVLDSVGLTVNSAELDRPEGLGLTGKSRDRVSILRKRASGLPPQARPSSLLVPASKASKRHTINGAPAEADFRRENPVNTNSANRGSTYKPLPNVGVSAALQQATQNAPPAGVAYVLRPTVSMSTQTPDWSNPASVTETTPHQAYAAFPTAEGVPPPPPAHSPPQINSISPSIYSVASFNPNGGRPDRRASRSSFWAAEEIAQYGLPEGYHNAPVPPLPTMDELPLLPAMPDQPEVLEDGAGRLELGGRRRSSVAARMIDRTTREKQVARGSFYDPNGGGSNSDLPLAKADNVPSILGPASAQQPHKSHDQSPKLTGLGVPGAFAGFHSYAIPRTPEAEVNGEKENFNVPYLNPDGSHHGVQSPGGGTHAFDISPATTPSTYAAPAFGTSNPFATGQRSVSPALQPMLIAPTSMRPSRSRSSPNLRAPSPALSSTGSWTSAASGASTVGRAPSPNPPASTIVTVTVSADSAAAAFARRKSVTAPSSPKTPQNAGPAPSVFLRKASLVAIPSAASKRTSMYAAVTAAASSLNDMLASAVPPEGLGLPAMPTMAGMQAMHLPALGGIGAAIRKSASSSGLAGALAGGIGGAASASAAAVAATPAGLMPAIALPDGRDGRRAVSDTAVHEVKRRQSEGGLNAPQLRANARGREERMAKGRSFFLVQALESQGSGGEGIGKKGKEEVKGVGKGREEVEESSESESEGEMEVGVVRRVEVRA